MAVPQALRKPHGVQLQERLSAIPTKPNRIEGALLFSLPTHVLKQSSGLRAISAVMSIKDRPTAGHDSLAEFAGFFGYFGGDGRTFFRAASSLVSLHIPRWSVARPNRVTGLGVPSGKLFMRYDVNVGRVERTLCRGRAPTRI